MRELPRPLRQVCQSVSLRGIGRRSDYRHPQQDVTLKEPGKPSVNHNFRPAAESTGTDGRQEVKTHQDKDQIR